MGLLRCKFSGPVLSGDSDSVVQGGEFYGKGVRNVSKGIFTSRSIELESFGDFSSGKISKIGQSVLGELESLTLGNTSGLILLGEVLAAN